MSEVVWLRDLDGTGSMHPCAEGDPGARPYFPAPPTIDPAMLSAAIQASIDAVHPSQQAYFDNNELCDAEETSWVMDGHFCPVALCGHLNKALSEGKATPVDFPLETLDKLINPLVGIARGLGGNDREKTIPVKVSEIFTISALLESIRKHYAS